MSNLTDLFDRLNGTNLIVCKHHTDQNGSRTDSFFQFIKLDLTKLIYIHISDLKSMFFQPVTSMQDCMMLDLRCNNVISFGSISFCCCFQCPVIRLTSTCCKIDFLRICSKSLCNLLSSCCDSFFAFLRKAVDTGRISIQFCKIRKHCLHNFRRSLGCRRIIQVN